MSSKEELVFRQICSDRALHRTFGLRSYCGLHSSFGFCKSRAKWQSSLVDVWFSMSQGKYVKFLTRKKCTTPLWPSAKFSIFSLISEMAKTMKAKDHMNQ